MKIINLTMQFRTEIILLVDDLPNSWDDIVAPHNILLSKKFLKALQESQPNNMQNYFAAFYKDKILVGGAVLQYLDFSNHSLFKSQNYLNLNNTVVQTLANKLLIIGNNLVTGQNGFYFNLNLISKINAIKLLEDSSILIQKKVHKTKLVLFKDYEKALTETLQQHLNKQFQSFSVQPNMILELNNQWKTFDDYLNAFTTKYRTRAKSARKKAGQIEKRELSLEDIENHQKTLHQLYLQVAEEAQFNTFILSENHFYIMKKYLQKQFKVFAYFLDDKILCFYSLFINFEDADTYFLGYDKVHQKSMQLYLNMLLDMVEFGILNQKKAIIFGRTALEIKSTIGAEPQEIFGLVKHENFLLNTVLKKIIPKLNPTTDWTQRLPFKKS